MSDTRSHSTFPRIPTLTASQDPLVADLKGYIYTPWALRSEPLDNLSWDRFEAELEAMADDTRYGKDKGKRYRIMLPLRPYGLTTSLYLFRRTLVIR